MTIEFNCPNCDSLIAFDNKHCGKRARCLTCGQVFIIPAEDYAKAEKIKPKIEKPDPEPGFYKAVFIDSLKIWINPENVTAMIFVAALVCFNFFLNKSICCVNYITYIVVWGWLLGFYLNIIYETAYEIDTLPQIYLGTSFTFVWYIVKPFLIFVITMAAVQAPFIIALKLLAPYGITYENMWRASIGLHSILQILFLVGAFFFPMAVLTVAVGQSITMLRPDYILMPVFKAFVPYLILVALLVATYLLDIHTKQFDHSGWLITIGRLLGNLAVQILVIITMRAIGLFYRHYGCYTSF